MPGPLDALKKVQSVGPDANAEWHTNHPVLSALAGLIAPGIDPHQEVGAMDVAGAALPFLKFGKLKGLAEIAGKPTVFHGTNSVFEHFDPALGNTYDKLGSYIHAAEHAPAADSYSTVGSSFLRPPKGQHPNIIPITASSQNVLDMGSQLPTGEDWQHLQVPLKEIAEGRYKSPIIDRYAPTADEPHGHTGQQLAQRILEDYNDAIKGNLDQRGYAEDINFLLNDPNVLKQTPFDAIRYYESGVKPYWAFPKPEQLSTPWGTPLGALKKLKP